MPFFSEAALRSLRATNAAALDSRALIEAPTHAAAAGGGANTGRRTWTPVDDGAAVPCRLAPVNDGAVVIQAGQLTTPNRMLAVFDVTGPEVRQGYRLTITGKDLAGEPWTRVVVVLSPQAPRTYSVMRAFVCQDVGPAGA